MGVILKNNAVSTITTTLSASDVGLAVAAGTGSLFPTLGAGDYFYATLVSSGGTYEVIKVTARVNDTMTIVRAQEGTTAQSFASGSRLEARVTAASITDMLDYHDQASEISFSPTGAISATDVQSAIAELDSEAAKSATLAASSGSSLVGHIASGTGATARTVQSKLRDTVSVKDFGAVGNGVADDTAAIVAACAASNSIDFPTGTYKITATIEPGANKFLNFSNVTILSSVAGPAFLIRGNTDVVTFSGDVLIDCQSTVGSVGLKIQATSAIASPATTNTFDQLFVRNATIGVHLYSDGNQGIYYNDFYRVQVQDSTKGIFLETAGGGASQREVNANHFGMVTLQRCVDALTLNGTWGNYFDFVEAETNTGIAINLVNAFSVGINGGWIEGNTTNLSIGNVPNVYGVYIKASIDSALDSADTKFVYTPSEDRSIIIENSQYAKWFGRAGFEERVDIGDYGVAANDQGNSPDGYGRLRVTASQDFFRLSSGSPLFFMRARTGTEGWYFGLDNGATRLLDLQRSRAVLDTRLALANSAWDKNQLTLGAYYLWVDATGRLRIKSGAPVSDTDGTVVGTQT